MLFRKEYFRSPYYFFLKEGKEDMTLYFSVNNTASITLPDKTGVTLDVNKAEQIAVSGTGTLTYIVSK